MDPLETELAKSCLHYGEVFLSDRVIVMDH
jgi:hypothetical protein